MWHRNHKVISDTLLKWKKVITSESFANYLLTGLMPHLGALVESMEINPSSQDISALEVLFHFMNNDLVSLEQGLLVLKNHFFTRWLIVL